MGSEQHIIILFLHKEVGLTGRSFAEPEQLLEGAQEFLEGRTAIFEGWMNRVKWVIAHNGHYYSN
jgi:hypothetical protein